MAKPELGSKRQCQACSAKFFDLNKDPIVCPKCGAVFQVAAVSRAAARAAPVDDDEAPEAQGAELVSLEEADAVDDKVVVADDDIEIEDDGEDFLTSIACPLLLKIKYSPKPTIKKSAITIINFLIHSTDNKVWGISQLSRPMLFLSLAMTAFLILFSISFFKLIINLKSPDISNLGLNSRMRVVVF